MLEIFSNICQCWKLEIFPGYNSCIAETCVSFMAFNRNYQNSLCRGHLTSSFRPFGRSNSVPRRSLNPAVHPFMMRVSMMPDSYVHIACIHDVHIRNPLCMYHRYIYAYDGGYHECSTSLYYISLSLGFGNIDDQHM